MIIFGWGRQIIKQIGITFKNLCEHCHNEEYWVLSKITTWFTLFFIPVFPYETKYFLSCPVCKYGINLNQKQVDEIRPLAELNQLLIDKKITNEEYGIRISQFGNNSQNHIKETPTETKILENSTESKYCSECGEKIDKDSAYCYKCGQKL